MKKPELASTLVAGLLGAAFVWLLVRYWQATEENASWHFAAVGFVAGAAVQVGVRLLGVS